MRLIVLAALAVLAVSPAIAASSGNLDSANTILPRCKLFVSDTEKTLTLNQAWGRGQCAGIVSTLLYFSNNFDKCVDIPEEATVDQIVKVIIRYIEARPNRLHDGFRGLALEALADAWPCAPRKKP